MEIDGIIKDILTKKIIPSDIWKSDNEIHSIEILTNNPLSLQTLAYKTEKERNKAWDKLESETFGVLGFNPYVKANKE